MWHVLHKEHLANDVAMLICLHIHVKDVPALVCGGLDC